MNTERHLYVYETMVIATIPNDIYDNSECIYEERDRENNRYSCTQQRNKDGTNIYSSPRSCGPFSILLRFIAFVINIHMCVNVLVAVNKRFACVHAKNMI